MEFGGYGGLAVREGVSGERQGREVEVGGEGEGVCWGGKGPGECVGEVVRSRIGRWFSALVLACCELLNWIFGA